MLVPAGASGSNNYPVIFRCSVSTECACQLALNEHSGKWIASTGADTSTIRVQAHIQQAEKGTNASCADSTGCNNARIPCSHST